MSHKPNASRELNPYIGVLPGMLRATKDPFQNGSSSMKTLTKKIQEATARLSSETSESNPSPSINIQRPDINPSDQTLVSIQKKEIETLTTQVKQTTVDIEKSAVTSQIDAILFTQRTFSIAIQKDIDCIREIKTHISSDNKQKVLENFFQLSKISYDHLTSAFATVHHMEDYVQQDQKYLGNAAPLKDFAVLYIEKDPHFLLEPSALPLLHVEGENLLEQLEKLLSDYIEYKELESTLKMLKLITETEETAKKHIQEIFSNLPQDVQRLLLDTKDEHVTITPDDVAKLMKPIDPKTSSSITCVHLVAKKLSQEFEDKLSSKKKDQFLRLHALDILGHKQLKKYYNDLPETLKQSEEIPKPPYYGKGIRGELYKSFGAHYDAAEQTSTFKVFAPNAKRVDLLIKENDGQERSINMKKTLDGNWEVSTKEAPLNTFYRYKIIGADDKERIKADPYAQQSHLEIEKHEKIQYSVVCDPSFPWEDASFMEQRSLNLDSPASIYEVHIGSWKINDDGTKKNYREIAHDLALYCKTMNFTHIEIFGCLEHPAEESWGYQPSGFFSVNSRLGSLSDFKYLVNHMHINGIKVILDWIPGHFANDSFSFLEFDGSHLYEHEDPKRAYQPQWDVYTFDLEKKNIRDFLISSANFFAKECHIDGLRVDAVTSILYTNEGRSGGHLPHIKGKSNHHGSIHSDAKIFFRDLNSFLHTHNRGIETHAEEISGFDNLTGAIEKKDKTHSYSQRGLGFDKKWAMGSMHNVLSEHFRKDPQSRALSNISSAMEIDREENIVQVTSHDESANGKGSLRSGMKAKDLKEQFAQTRLYHAKVFCTPGIKLTMMGNELGQEEEWSGRLIRHINGTEKGCSSVDWKALDADWLGPNYSKLTQNMIKDLNSLYISHPALKEGNKGKDFTWIKADDATNHVMSFHRTSKDQKSRVMCIQNYGENGFANYTIELPDSSYDPLNQKLISLKTIFSTDDPKYGGEGRDINPKVHRDGNKVFVTLQLPPSTGIILEEVLKS